MNDCCMVSLESMVPWVHTIFLAELEKQQVPAAQELHDPIPIVSPQLDRRSLENLDELLARRDPELLRQLDSSPDYAEPHAAYSHESSITLAYYRSEGAPCRLNMDRGGFVKRADGTFACCLADGAGGSGVISAFTAAIIVNYVLGYLYSHPLGFSDKKLLHVEAKRLFSQWAEALATEVPFTYHARGKRGFTTCIFADCSHFDAASCRVNIASLGDSAAFHISRDEKKAYLLNKMTRVVTAEGQVDVTDMGGWISSAGEIDRLRSLSTHVAVIPKKDFIVLVSDGLIDNLYAGSEEEIVSIVSFSPFFDTPLNTLLSFTRSWEQDRMPRLPTATQLKEFIAANSSPELLDVPLTAPIITNRLKMYVQFVTYSQSVHEEAICSYRESPYKSRPKSYLKPADEPKTDDHLIITIAPN